MKKRITFIATIIFVFCMFVSNQNASPAKSNIVLTMPPILAAVKDIDRIPDPFSFTPVTNAKPGTFVTSNIITVTGINDTSTVNITGGVYSIDGGPFTNASKNVVNEQKIQVGVMSSYSYSTSKTAVLNIGGVTASFTVRTMDDTTPDKFTFVDQTDVPLNTPIISNPIYVSGITGPSPISISQGSYSMNGAAFTSASGTVTNGQSVRVQVISANTHSTSKSTTLTIGGVSDTFTVATIADTTPDKFTFIDQTNVELNTIITSNAITVSGITVPVPISISAGLYSINGGPFTSASGTVTNGQSLRVQLLSASTYSTSRHSTLTIGGVTDTFTVTTKARPTGVYILPNHTSYINSIDYYKVVGEVLNNTPYVLRFVKISANLFNTSGQLADTDFTYIYLDNLEPGKKTCFELSFQNSVNASYYNFEPVSYRTDGVPPPNLTVYNNSGSYDYTFGWYEILGLVRNDSGRLVEYVMPIGTLYNSAGYVIGCDFTFVNSTDLAAGQSSSFEMTFTGRDYSDVSSYRLQVDGN